MGKSGAHGGTRARPLRTLAIILWRFVKTLPLILIFPILLLIAMTALALVDLVSAFRKKTLQRNQPANNASATVVIPNWNGSNLLEK